MTGVTFGLWFAWMFGSFLLVVVSTMNLVRRVRQKGPRS